MTKTEWIKKYKEVIKEMGISEDQKVFTVGELDKIACAMECSRLMIIKYLRSGRI